MLDLPGLLEGLLQHVAIRGHRAPEAADAGGAGEVERCSRMERRMERDIEAEEKLEFIGEMTVDDDDDNDDDGV